MTYVIAIAALFIYSIIIYLLLRPAPIKWPLNSLLWVLFGVLSAFLSLGLEFLWNYFLADFMSSHHSLILIDSLIGVALIEEGMKWMWLVIFISRWPSFNYYSQGIVCACGIAAGFNLIEELIYASVDSNPGNMLLRNISAVPVHFLLAIVMGFLFAQYRFEDRRYFWFSLLVPVVLHAIYDFFILQQYADLLVGIALLVILGCLSLSIWIIRIALKFDKLRVFPVSDNELSNENN